VPTGLIVNDGKLTGLQMTHTEVIEGKARKLAGTEYQVLGPMTISSIGSIPESMPGIPQAGEVYRYANPAIGLVLEGRTAVYAAGNVLTGKGNIKDSLVSGTEVGSHVAEQYLGLADDSRPFELTERERSEVAAEAKVIAADVEHRKPLSLDAMKHLREVVRERQAAVGYDGNYREWIKRMTPPDLH
jgi:hypothetical protein